jgi:hypothetical protein
VKAGDPSALAEIMARALQLSQGEHGAMAKAARSNAGGFAKEVLQKKTLQIYDYLLGSGMENAFTLALHPGEYADGLHKVPV